MEQAKKQHTKTKIAEAIGKKLKVSVVLNEIDIDIDTEGSAIVVAVNVDGLKLMAPVNTKSFRKVQTAVKAAIAAGERDNFIVMMTGEIDLKNKQILNAGIVAQQKALKQETTPTLGNENAPAPVSPAPTLVPSIDDTPAVKNTPTPTIVYKKVRTVLGKLPE